jgi:hypothetical protein
MATPLNVDLAVFKLLDTIGLRPSHGARLYNFLLPSFGEVADASREDVTWPLQLVNRRYVSWPDCHSIHDIATGETHAELPVRPVESLVYDLALLVGQHAEKSNAAAEGRRKAEGRG